MGQIDPALAASFKLRIEQQVRWFQSHLLVLSSASDNFDSEQLAITGALNELRQLIQAEPLTNDRHNHLHNLRDESNKNLLHRK
jgi:hypothetical protein